MKRAEETIAAQAKAVEDVEAAHEEAREAKASAAAAVAAAREKAAAATRAMEGMLPAATVHEHVARAEALERELADLRGSYAAVKDEHSRALTALRDASLAREAAAGADASLALECLARVAREAGVELPAPGTGEGAEAQARRAVAVVAARVKALAGAGSPPVARNRRNMSQGVIADT